MKITNFIISVKSIGISSQWEMTKAKRAYKKKHPKCAVCGYDKDLEVHHIVPVSVDPSLACDENNFITLCDYGNKGCHYVFGHHRNFRSKWNEYIVELAQNVRDLLDMSDHR
jgi:hypothetical protein